MRRVALSLWMLKSIPGKPPHVSRCRLSAEDAAQMGAVAIVPGSTIYRDVPETESEKRQAQVNYQSADRDGAQPPR